MDHRHTFMRTPTLGMAGKRFLKFGNRNGLKLSRTHLHTLFRTWEAGHQIGLLIKEDSLSTTEAHCAIRDI
jgi:hypothetical protein